MAEKNWKARDEPKEAHHGRNKKHKKLQRKGVQQWRNAVSREHPKTEECSM